MLLRPELKKESNVGHFDTESNIAENRMLVSTRTPDGTAIQHLKCIRKVAVNATVSFVMSVCQCVRPPETTHFPVDKFCFILY